MYGFIFENSQKCTELGIRTSVHYDFEDFGIFENLSMGFLKIRTFHWDYSMKRPFFFLFPGFFLTLLIFIRKLSYKFPPPENPGK